MMLKRLSFITAILFLCLGLGSTGSFAEEPSLTVLVYMTGSDLESRAGSATADLLEMQLSMKETDKLKLAVMTGGSRKWKEDIPSDRNCIWEIGPKGRVLLNSESTGSMGQADTLSDFLWKGVSLLPSDRFALIIWDHGGGPLEGICFDERTSQEGCYDCLGLDELSRALQNSPFAEKPLMFIGFDACLMATSEVACAVSPFSEYMIASQEPEPVSGWEYSFLSKLSSAQDGRAAGTQIIEAYADSLRDSFVPVTLSCLDLSQAGALRTELDRLFHKIRLTFSADHYPVFASCRVNTKEIGSASLGAWDLVDLFDLADVLEKNEVSDTIFLREVLKSMVVGHYSNEDYVNGVSIYFPFENKLKYSYPWSSRYASLNFSKEYQRYLSDYSKVWLGESRVSWTDRAAVEAHAFQNQQRISVQLSPEEANDTAYTRLLIMEKVSNDEFQLVYIEENPTRVGEEITGIYRGYALYLVDQNGRVLAGPLTWERISGGVATYALLECSNFSQEGVYLLWSEGQDGQYYLSEIETFQEQIGMFTKSSVQLHEGDTVFFGGYARKQPSMDCRFEDWPYGDTITSSPATVREEDAWHLEFLPLFSADDRVAVFEITDLNANVHLSSLIPIDNPDKFPLTQESQHQDSPEIQIVMNRVEMLTGSDPGLFFDFSITNQLDDRVFMNLSTVTLNRSSLVDSAFHFRKWQRELENRQTEHLQILITAEDLQEAKIDQLQQLMLTFAIQKNKNAVSYENYIFHVPIDLGMFSLPAVKESTPISITEYKDMSLQLLSLEQDNRGNLTGKVYIENLSRETACLDARYGVMLDDRSFPGALSAEISVVLPPNCSTICSYHAYLAEYEGGILLSKPKDAVSSITGIGFIAKDKMDNYETIWFQLS